MARICVVTAGHLATTPRMVKAADALAEEGHQVRLVSTRFVRWATHADGNLLTRRHGHWRWSVVDYSAGEPWVRRWSGLRRRGAAALAALSPERCPADLVFRGYSRVHPELVRAILRQPEDLIYAGTAGALAAAAVASDKSGTPYAVDLEDFHTGEQDDSKQARRSHRFARRIENYVLPGASFRTAGSAAIANAYRDRYGLEILAIHNTFPLPAKAPVTGSRKPGPLRLYWFSQTIGPQRGLEDAVHATGKAEIAMELHLRGQRPTAYVESLDRLAREVAPKLRLKLHDPEPPDRMVELCAPYDVGLALEQAHVPNRALCLSNKPLTYLLAGLAIAFTDTPGQRPLATAIGPELTLTYSPGDIDTLAAGLVRWARDPATLAAARAASWKAAQRRWHWDHPQERGALVGAAEAALAGRPHGGRR